MKKFWKRALCGVSVLALTLGGLTACGGRNPMENAALAKENVYRMQEITFPDMGGDDSSVRANWLWDGRIYVMMQLYHWSENGNNQDYKLVSVNQDGSDAKVVPIEMPASKSSDMFGEDTPGNENIEPGQDGAEGSTGDGPGADDVPAVDDVTAVDDEATTDDVTAAGDGDAGDGPAADDGESAPGVENAPAAPADTEDEDVDDEVLDEDFAVDPWGDYGYENVPYVYENTYFGTFSFANGRIYALENYYYEYEDYTIPDSYVNIRKTYICAWDLDGSLLWESEMESLSTEDQYLYVNAMLPKPDGSMTMLLSGDATYKQDVSADGVIGSRDKFESDNADLLNRAYYLLPKADGTLVLIYADENDWTKQYIVNYDVDKDQVGEASLMPASFALYGYNGMSAGMTSDLIYSDTYGVYTFNAGDEEGTKRMDFINSDVGITYLMSLTELDENSFLGMFYTDEGKTAGGIFTYVPPEDIPDKKVLVLAGDSIGYDLRNRVVEFNRNSDEYRITLRTYDSYRTMDDWYAGATQLNNEIITGNMPDILIAYNLPVENYIAKGLLEDIGKMIEGDEELSQVEFVQNVFDAYSINGKLYYVIPSFNIRTMVGKVSLVGDRSTWTMAEMQQLMASLPEGTSLMGDSVTRESFFNMMMQYCGSDFVDVETGKCDFDTPGFIAIMEFAKTLPQELDDDYWYNYDWELYESQYRENRTVLNSLYINYLSNLNYQINGYMGEDVSYIGFPTESGMGSVVGMNDAYCISSKSANKDAAWEFLRYYLTDEYQNELRYGLPVQKDRFEELAQEVTQRPYYIDENGEKQEYDDTFWMNGEEIILPPMSQEQVDKIINFIYSVNKPVYDNDDVMNIINEEMDSFYSGQKSAEEVAKIIQSRAQVFVDENR